VIRAPTCDSVVASSTPGRLHCQVTTFGKWFTSVCLVTSSIISYGCKSWRGNAELQKSYDLLSIVPGATPLPAEDL